MKLSHLFRPSRKAQLRVIALILLFVVAISVVAIAQTDDSSDSDSEIPEETPEEIVEEVEEKPEEIEDETETPDEEPAEEPEEPEEPTEEEGDDSNSGGNDLPEEAFPDIELEINAIYPEKVTRGESIELEAKVSNVGVGVAKDVSLEWILPDGFTIVEGSLEQDCGDITPADVRTCRSNIRVEVALVTALGDNSIRVAVSHDDMSALVDQE